MKSRPVESAIFKLTIFLISKRIIIAFSFLLKNFRNFFVLVFTVVFLYFSLSLRKRHPESLNFVTVPFVIFHPSSIHVHFFHCDCLFKTFKYNIKYNITHRFDKRESTKRLESLPVLENRDVPSEKLKRIQITQAKENDIL